MAKHLLSKSTFIRGQQCQKSLYLHNKRPFLRDKLSAAQLAKFKRGTDVGVLARSLFPGGIDMTPRSPSLYQAQRQATLDALNDPQVHTIYEAVFQYDDTLIMLDILQRDESGWRAYEVKSSRSISQTFIKDAALQYYVLNGNNLIINDFCLIHINPQYFLGDKIELEGLFSFFPVLSDVKQQLPEIAAAIALSKQTLQLSNSPAIKPGPHCHLPYPCDFIGHCWKNTPLKIRSLRTFAVETVFNSWKTDNGPASLRLTATTKEQQLELKAFDEESLQYYPVSLIPHLKRLQQARSFASIFILTHQPAVPVIKGSNPYQLLPLAACVFNPIDHSFTETSFQQDQEGMQQFLKFMKELTPLFGQLRCYDVNELQTCIHSAQKLMNNADKKAFEGSYEGILQLLDQVPIFHPGFGSEFRLEDLYYCITGKTTELKDVVWLTADFHKADNEEDMTRQLTRLRPYTQAINEIFESITTLET